MPTMEQNLEHRELENLKEKYAKMQKVKTGWMIAAIISFSMFAICLAILLCR